MNSTNINFILSELKLILFEKNKIKYNSTLIKHCFTGASVQGLYIIVITTVLPKTITCTYRFEFNTPHMFYSDAYSWLENFKVYYTMHPYCTKSSWHYLYVHYITPKIPYMLYACSVLYNQTKIIGGALIYNAIENTMYTSLCLLLLWILK